MATTFTKIASVSVGSGGAATIDFTSIPSTYTDLVVKLSARGTQSNTYATVNLSFNGSSANFSVTQLYGSGAAAVSGYQVTNLLFDAVGSTATANTFNNGEFYVPNYASSNYKSVSSDNVTETNATTAYTELYTNLWSNTAAINQITLTPASGTFVQYSTATLYGIKSS